MISLSIDSTIMELAQSIPKKRRSRAKRCLGWERLEIETRGLYSARLAKIAARYPRLTPTQLRIAALMSGMLPSFEIARILCTTEHAVEKVRSRIRKALALPEDASLAGFLVTLIEQ